MVLYGLNVSLYGSFTLLLFVILESYKLRNTISLAIYHCCTSSLLHNGCIYFFESDKFENKQNHIETNFKI